MIKKIFIGLGLLGITLLFIGPVNAQADDDIVSFGIRPTNAFEDKPETFSYFSHEVSPGLDRSDEALVVNDGNVPVTLLIYVADGITAQNGGTAFTKQGELASGGSRGVNSWISLQKSEISLGPGEEELVPFTIHVPLDASPGQYVAGLVVELVPNNGTEAAEEEEAQFAVTIIRRVGVAVVVDVPGSHVSGLEITNAYLNQQDEDQGATFAVFVHNTGNIFTKAEGYLSISDQNSEELVSIPLTMDTVLPGDNMKFYATHPIHFGDGEYWIKVVLYYGEKMAVFEKGKIIVKDGQPVIESDPVDNLLPPGVVEIVTSGSSADKGVASVIIILIFGLIFLFALLVFALIIFVLLRRKNKDGTA